MKSNMTAILRRILQFLKRVFLHNWGMKLISLFFAVILWNYAALTLKTTRSIILRDVDLTVSNAALLRQRGLTLSENPEDLADDLYVTVSTQLSNAGSLSSDNVSVVCDLSSVNTAGTHTITLTGRSVFGTVVSVYPSSVTVDVELLATRELPIHVLTEGSPDEGCVAGEPSLSTQSITVTGPAALIESIQSAQVHVPVYDAKNDVRVSRPLELLGENGNVIESSLISTSISDTIVTVPVRRQAEFPLLAEKSIVGADQLPEGYEISSVTVYPETVPVLGTQTAIDKLQSEGGLTLSAIDVSDTAEDIRAYPTILTPEGVSLTRNESVFVIIRIQKKTETVTWDNIPVEIRGLSDKLSCELSSPTLKVTVTAPESKTEALPENHVRLYVDLSDRTAGTCVVPVHVVIDDSYEATVQLSQESVTAVLSPLHP